MGGKFDVIVITILP